MTLQILLDLKVPSVAYVLTNSKMARRLESLSAYITIIASVSTNGSIEQGNAHFANKTLLSLENNYF